MATICQRERGKEDEGSWRINALWIALYHHERRALNKNNTYIYIFSVSATDYSVSFKTNQDLRVRFQFCYIRSLKILSRQ